ncbi:alpha-ribazole phosphatase [Desulfuromonas thiophila]|uniref:Alpha-ribazole phosphatase n=2 Tax=Desulfuromonas thiophila TaxID=57664 RepID=A0A1G7F2B5_9BACT|nr:alpha-ribazole phosphatase [Desulfuromonas thiophila]
MTAPSMTTQITLIRHAAIATEFDGHYIGRSDVPLSADGRQQAERLVRHLSRPGFPAIDALWCSPAQRARQTAEPLIRQSLRPVTIDERLQEINFGDWEGLDFAQILHNDPQRVNQWAAFTDDFCFPAGESLKQFRHRLDAVVESILAEQAGHLVIVSHGGVLRGLICQLLGWSLKDHLKFTIERGGYATLYLDGCHAVLTGLYNHGV